MVTRNPTIVIRDAVLQSLWADETVGAALDNLAESEALYNAVQEKLDAAIFDALAQLVARGRVAQVEAEA